MHTEHVNANTTSTNPHRESIGLSTIVTVIAVSLIPPARLADISLVSYMMFDQSLHKLANDHLVCISSISDPLQVLKHISTFAFHICALRPTAPLKILFQSLEWLTIIIFNRHKISHILRRNIIDTIHQLDFCGLIQYIQRDSNSLFT